MCSSKFAKKNVLILTNHIIEVHMKIKDLKCKDCSKSFPTKYHMESLHKRVHLLIKPPQNTHVMNVQHLSRKDNKWNGT